MGRFERPASGGITKYYWYPGERTDWIRAAIAGGCGLLTIVLVAATTGSHLWASVLGTSITAGVAGVTFGRKDVRALQTFAGFAALDTGRAVWRAVVKGFGAAAAAVLVVHSANGVGFVASWLLPVVPAIVGAIAHQAGMMYERAAQATAEQEALLEPSRVRTGAGGSDPRARAGARSRSRRTRRPASCSARDRSARRWAARSAVRWPSCAAHCGPRRR